METIPKFQITNAPFLNGERLSADIGNLLVLSPHPDDESLGCGGLIAMLKETGSSVSIVFVTSGSASHTSETHPPNILTKVRELEAIKACSELGVHLENVHFLRAPDSGLSQLKNFDLDVLVRAIDTIYTNGNFSAIALPWRRDPHPDHRVVSVVGKMFLDGITQNLIEFEYPIWLWKNGAEADWPLEGETVAYRLDISRVFPKKWRAVHRHRSQLGKIIDDDPNGFVLTDELLEPFNSHIEHYFVARPKINTLKESYFEELYANQLDPWNFKNSEYELTKYRRAIEVLGEERFNAGLELGCSIGVQSEMLSKLCEQLIAVDITKIAIQEAKFNCSDIQNISFEVCDVVKNFPEGNFDLITCCEMGYYLEMEDLERLFENISTRLLEGGIFLMVHWTPFVPDYPLSGDAVHERFIEFSTETGLFEEVTNERHDNYRLQCWRKLSTVSDT